MIGNVMMMTAMAGLGMAGSTGKSPRGWWDAAAQGAFCGRERQVKHCYAGATVEIPLRGKTVPGFRLPSGATYAAGTHGGLYRTNHPKNKHQRRARTIAAR